MLRRRGRGRADHVRNPAADIGVQHTPNGIVDKTFAASVDQVHAASRGALAGMAIKVTLRQPRAAYRQRWE